MKCKSVRTAIIQSFKAAQLAKMGCGHTSVIRRRYFPPKGLLTDEKLGTCIYEGKKTRLIPFHLLTTKDQARVEAYLIDEFFNRKIENTKNARNERIEAEIDETIDQIENLFIRLKVLKKARSVK